MNREVCELSFLDDFLVFIMIVHAYVQVTKKNYHRSVASHQEREREREEGEQ